MHRAKVSCARTLQYPSSHLGQRRQRIGALDGHEVLVMRMGQNRATPISALDAPAARAAQTAAMSTLPGQSSTFVLAGTLGACPVQPGVRWPIAVVGGICT